MVMADPSYLGFCKNTHKNSHLTIYEGQAMRRLYLEIRVELEIEDTDVLETGEDYGAGKMADRKKENTNKRESIVGEGDQKEE